MSPQNPRSRTRISRRAFLQRAGAALLSTALIALDPPVAWADGHAASPSKALWRKTTFATCVGQSFKVNPGTGSKLTLKLLRIENGTTKIYLRPGQFTQAPAGSCFILLFRGPRSPVLSQNTYEFSHPDLGKFSLFITPGQTVSQGQNYRAVVNHVQA